MIVKKILVFSCTIQGFKKLVPVVKHLLIRNDILLQVVVCSIQEVEYCKAEGIAYHRVDEYSSLTRMADWDTDLAIDALQYLLDQETPDLLLTIDSGGFMESMFHYCKKRNILALALQHAPLAHRLREAPAEAGCYLYWGNYFAKQLHLLLQVPMDNIVVTGSAQFDQTILQQTDRAELAQMAGLDIDKKWFVFCGQCPKDIPLQYDPRIAVRKAGAELQKYPDIQFVYKPHPGEMPDALQELESEIPNLHLVRNVDTVTLLHQAAAVMTFYSTVAIDAALLGKPILLFNRQDLMHTVMPLYDMGAALCCTSEQQIQEEVCNLVTFDVPKEIHQMVIQELNGGSKGQAIEKIVHECLIRL